MQINLSTVHMYDNGPPAGGPVLAVGDCLYYTRGRKTCKDCPNLHKGDTQCVYMTLKKTELLC